MARDPGNFKSLLSRKRVEVPDAGITKSCASDYMCWHAHCIDGETEAQRGWEPQRGTEAAALSAPLAASPSTAGSGSGLPPGHQGRGRRPQLSRHDTRPSHTACAHLPDRFAPSLPAPRAQSPPAADAGRSGEAAPAASWPQPCPRPAAERFTCTPHFSPRPPLPLCP